VCGSQRTAGRIETKDGRAEGGNCCGDLGTLSVGIGSQVSTGAKYHFRTLCLLDHELDDFRVFDAHITELCAVEIVQQLNSASEVPQILGRRGFALVTKAVYAGPQDASVSDGVGKGVEELELR
jgi:hypothetical protein